MSIKFKRRKNHLWDISYKYYPNKKYSFDDNIITSNFPCEPVVISTIISSGEIDDLELVKQYYEKIANVKVDKIILLENEKLM